MKKNISIFVLVLSCLSCLAQDVIVKTNGDEIKSKVTKVGLDVIEYKVYENLTGPDYVIAKKDVFMIRYENGYKDVFTKAADPIDHQEQENPQAVNDQNTNQNGNNVASGNNTKTIYNSNAPLPFQNAVSIDPKSPEILRVFKKWYYHGVHVKYRDIAKVIENGPDKSLSDDYRRHYKNYRKGKIITLLGSSGVTIIFIVPGLIVMMDARARMWKDIDKYNLIMTGIKPIE